MKTDKQIEEYALENILEEDSIEGFVKMKQWIEGAKWMRDNSDVNECLDCLGLECLGCRNYSNAIKS